ncbi:MAG: peptidase M23 [Flavobacteriaceae bacterium]|mgnify:FL=1|nr:peptidase M23 [Flavobacteriaceae bacterium]
MSKVKYYYDHDTLSYREIKVTNKNRISGVLLFLLASFFFGITSLLILLNSDIINTPSEVAQKRSIENFKLQFDILNKKLGQLEKVIANIENRDNNLYRVYFEASPIPEEQRRAGFGGINRYKDLEGYDNSDLIINTTKRLDILTKQTVVQSRSLEEIESLAKNKASLIEAIPTIQPIKNKDLTRVASGYGYRIDPFTKIRRFHYGMDFTAKRGTPIYATGNGIVKRADNRSSGYGKHIRIDHGFGYVSLYAHLSKYKVRRGQKVKRGDIIGYVGNSGRSVGPHLHYEILKDNKKINPLNFYYGNLSAQEYEALLTQSNQENQSMD